MKIDFSTFLIGLDGEVLKDPDVIDRQGRVVKKGRTQSLGRVCVDALVAVERNSTPNGKTSFERYQLAEKINDKKEVDLEAEEIVELKDRVGAVFGPAIVGPAFKLLEGKKAGK